jgi:D-alanine-D-alanine ligase
VSRFELEGLREEIPVIFGDLGSELFVKPIANGSSLGAQYAPTEEVLFTVLTDLLAKYEDVLVEEFIRGKEATVAVLDNYRNESVYVLPVVEIIPPNGLPLFSHTDKYNGTTQEIVPGRFSYGEKSQLNDAAALVHKAIDCKHYSRSDFIVRDGDVYFLEVNTLPGLTSESLFPKAAQAVGLEYNQLIEHLVENAH